MSIEDRIEAVFKTIDHFDEKLTNFCFEKHPIIASLAFAAAVSGFVYFAMENASGICMHQKDQAGEYQKVCFRRSP